MQASVYFINSVLKALVLHILHKDADHRGGLSDSSTIQKEDRALASNNFGRQTCGLDGVFGMDKNRDTEITVQWVEP